jgi:hypothetical protein
MRPQPADLLKPTLLAVLLACALGTSARADITSSLVGYYKLDESAGLTAADSSGLAPAATLNNFYSDPAQWVAGWTNHALQFDPTYQQYAVIDDSTNGFNFATRTSPSFTLATWVQGATAQTNGAALVARGYGHGGEQYLMDIYNGYYRLGIRDANGSPYTIQQSLAALRCDGTWQLVVGVFDSAAGANHLKIYVNGQLAYQQTATNSLYNITHDVSLGGREDTSSSGYNVFFGGKLDDVRLFARALSASDVLELYYAAGKAPEVLTPPQNASLYVGDTANFSVTAQGTLPLSYQWRMDGTNLPSATNATYSIANVQLASAGTYDVVITNLFGSTPSSAAVLTVANPPADISSGLVAYFKLDEASGTLAADAIGTTSGANLQNELPGVNQWLPAGGRTNGAYNFPGLTDNANPLSGQYMVINDGGALDFSTMATPALTVTAWVKTPPNFIEPGGVGLVARGYGRGGEQYVLDLFDNCPRFFVRDASGNTYMARADGVGLGTNAIHINTGAWAHLVGVLDPTVSPALIKLFINGQFVISANAAPSFLASTSDTTLGCRQDSSTSGYNVPFTGRMDDVRIYNRALTPADVQALFYSVGYAAPTLALPLVNTTNFVLAATTLSVAADGTPPFSYQWQWYGTNLAGQTASTFNIPVSQLSNSGPYSVVVTNLYGSVTSSAYLAVVQLAANDYTTALAAEWTFDETSGTAATDATGNGHTLNLVNFPADNSQWVSPARTGARALRFNAVADDPNGGTNDYCLTATGLALPYNYDLFTFAFWLKLDSATYGSNPRVITPLGGTWALWNSSGGMRIYNGTPGGANPQVNKWTHYVLVFDRFNHIYSCYVNGVKTVNNLSVAAKTATTAATQWIIGHNENTAQGADYFRGQLDDMRVYNRLLNDTQVAALYASYPGFLQILADPQSVSVQERSAATFTVAADGSPTPTIQWQRNGVNIPGATNATYTLQYASLSDNNAHFHAVVSNSANTLTSADALLTVSALPGADMASNLVLYYPFDETSGDIAHDASPNHTDGTLYNWSASAGKWESGKIGGALHFNGGPFDGGTTVSNNNYVQVPPLALADGNNFTFAFWAKLDPSRPTFNNPRIFATYGTGSWVVWERSSAPTGIGFWHGTGATPVPEANIWHYYIVTFDRVANTYNVYVDGLRKVVKGVPTNPSPEVDPTGSGGYAWVIGHRENITAPVGTAYPDTESFIGWLDEVRVYNRQFTINDAEALYQAANVPPALAIQASGNNVVFSWPSWASSYTLKSATSLASGAAWTTVSGTPVLVDAAYYQTNSVGAGTRFFRLAK